MKPKMAEIVARSVVVVLRDGEALARMSQGVTAFLVIGKNCPPCVVALNVLAEVAAEARTEPVAFGVATRDGLDTTLDHRLAQDLLSIREPEAFRAITGITVIPSLLVINKGTHVFSVIIGEPTKELLHAALNRAAANGTSELDVVRTGKGQVLLPRGLLSSPAVGGGVR